jgi:hypothetical protein
MEGRIELLTEPEDKAQPLFCFEHSTHSCEWKSIRKNGKSSKARNQPRGE